MHRTAAAALFAAAIAPPLPAQPPSAVPPQWARGATCYEIVLRSFFDADGDGVGDLAGLTAKLDYINDGTPSAAGDLGARCIWLTPVTPASSYHGYDATDYYRVDPRYGTNDDFRRLVSEAHRRGIRVLVDMVLNHASSEHPWFKSALVDTTSPYRGWFRWSPTDPGPPAPGRQQAWHRSPVREEWYYGIFWHEMPDLNYGHPAVREEAKRIASFWLEEMDVDGFRLDAIPYLVEEGERFVGTGGTHAFLREWAAHVRRVRPDAFTVGEVWDSVGAMLPYYPDQLDAHFSFESSAAILEAVRTGSGRTLYASFLRLGRAVPATRWSHFLRNHDQTRTMTYLGGDLARAKLATTLLLTLPGVPFVYYGEEIGMTGDKPDPRLRTPMHWRRAPAAGFTTGLPWEPLQPDSMTANVEALEGDSTSLLHLHRRLIHLRASSAALGGDDLTPLETGADDVVAFLRRDGERAIVVVANLGEDRRRVALSAGGRTLPAGRYAARAILGGAAVAPLHVAGDGRVDGWSPLAALAPLEAHVIEVWRLPASRR